MEQTLDIPFRAVLVSQALRFSGWFRERTRFLHKKDLSSAKEGQHVYLQRQKVDTTEYILQGRTSRL